MATQLQLYNAALSHLEQPPLVTLTDETEPRRQLDLHYADCLMELLERGFWKFALRTVKVDHDAAVTPAFGYSFAFSKPIDFVRTYTISSSDTLDPPERDWLEESQLWHANCDPIYLRYVSFDANYGLKLTLYPARYRVALEWLLASKIAGRVTTADKSRELATTMFETKLGESQSFDAMLEPAKDLPTGNWVNGRFATGSWRGRRYQRG